MSSYPILLRPSPVLLLLFISFPLLLLFPETSLCTAVAKKEPKFRNSGEPNEANCTVPCAVASHINDTKPASGFPNSISSMSVSLSSSSGTDGLNVSGAIHSQNRATSASSPAGNRTTVADRPLNDTEPRIPNQSLNTSRETERQPNVVRQPNDPSKEPVMPVPSSKPVNTPFLHVIPTSQSTVKNPSYPASTTSPSPIPRSNVSANSAHLTNVLDSASDSIPGINGKTSSNATTTATFSTSRPAVPVAPTNAAASVSQPGSAKPTISGSVPSTKTTSPPITTPPSTTTITTTPSTTITTMIPTGDQSPQSPVSSSPPSALEPKNPVTTGAPVELSTTTTMSEKNPQSPVSWSPPSALEPQTPVTTGAPVKLSTTAAAAARDVNSPISTPAVSHLADTASLLAVLLFGLLFFLVTVGVFVMQAFESYRRKDYTQVDYLINGMYSDSGV